MVERGERTTSDEKVSEAPQCWLRCCRRWFPVFVRAGVFTGIVTVQSVSQSVSAWRKTDRGLVGGEVGGGRTGERGHFKRLSPVSNSSQRDYTMLSSLFNLRLKRGALCFFSISLFLSLSQHNLWITG